MSLERVNVNVKFDPDMHSVLKAMAAMADKGLGETIEAMVAPVLLAKLHEARLLVQAVDGQSETVKDRQRPSAPVNGSRNQSISVEDRQSGFGAPGSQ